ncbi:helix-turn-helix domain-containing protein [Patescibacteria group bacterium]|nr:helix-turn-helix domain-containing protein [Patescibacteria group bacterium]
MKHLTAADRGSIETLLQEQYTNKLIAKRLGKHPSTISREIKKGLDGNGIYHAWVAQVAYETNRKRCKQIHQNQTIPPITAYEVLWSAVSSKVGIQPKQPVDYIVIRLGKIYQS